VVRRFDGPQMSFKAAFRSRTRCIHGGAVRSHHLGDVIERRTEHVTEHDDRTLAGAQIHQCRLECWIREVDRVGSASIREPFRWFLWVALASADLIKTAETDAAVEPGTQ